MVPRAGGLDPLVHWPKPSGEFGGLLATDSAGRCALYHADTLPAATAGRCAIHSQLGASALPQACRQFPRVAVLRPGSTALSLSHFCPTATRLLEGGSDGVEVVEAPASLLVEPLEGLDLRSTTVPPLLRPDAAFSWAAFEVWERFVVSQLTDSRLPIPRALARVIWCAEMLRQWRLGQGPLEDCSTRILDDSSHEARAGGAWDVSLAGAVRAYDFVRGTVPADIRPPRLPPDERAWRHAVELWRSSPRPWRRYLAARFWASWVVHDSAGLRSAVRWLLLVNDVLLVELSGGPTVSNHSLVEAIRRSDLLLVHLLDPATMARRLSELERDPLERAAWR